MINNNKNNNNNNDKYKSYVSKDLEIHPLQKQDK